MLNYIQEGEVLTITNTTSDDILSGDFVVVGYLFGVACGDILAGEDGEIQTEGVFDLPKDASVFAVGDRVEWEPTGGTVTASGSGSIMIGVCVQAAATGAATVRVKLCSSGITGA
jgi:predicted RecA/RadA family phage recombinase